MKKKTYKFSIKCIFKRNFMLPDFYLKSDVELELLENSEINKLLFINLFIVDETNFFKIKKIKEFKNLEKYLKKNVVMNKNRIDPMLTHVANEIFLRINDARKKS